MGKIVALCKGRASYTPARRFNGGLGKHLGLTVRYGVEFKNNVKAAWRKEICAGESVQCRS